MIQELISPNYSNYFFNSSGVTSYLINLVYKLVSLIELECYYLRNFNLLFLFSCHSIYNFYPILNGSVSFNSNKHFSASSFYLKLTKAKYLSVSLSYYTTDDSISP